VHLTNDLKSAEHCYESYCKADRMLGMVKRTVKHRNRDMMVRLYKRVVRPHLNRG